MSLIKSTFKRWDGTTWNIHYFRTSADIVDETATKKNFDINGKSKFNSFRII